MAASTSMSGAWSGACNGWPASCANTGLATVEATAYRFPCASWYDAVLNVWSSALDSPKAKASWFASGMWAAGVAMVALLTYAVVIVLLLTNQQDIDRHFLRLCPTAFPLEALPRIFLPRNQ